MDKDKGHGREKHNKEKTKTPENSRDKMPERSSCKVATETPQMKAIRERIHENSRYIPFFTLSVSSRFIRGINAK